MHDVELVHPAKLAACWMPSQTWHVVGYGPCRIFSDERRSDRVTSAGPGEAKIANHGAGTALSSLIDRERGVWKTWLAKQSRAAITPVSHPHPHLVSRATRRGNWETGARPPIKPLNRPNTFLSKPTAQAASNRLRCPRVGGCREPQEVQERESDAMDLSPSPQDGCASGWLWPHWPSAGRLILGAKCISSRGQWSVRRESPGCIAHADARHLEMLRRGLFMLYDVGLNRSPSPQTQHACWPREDGDGGILPGSTARIRSVHQGLVSLWFYWGSGYKGEQGAEPTVT
ncbi:hypothetical protein BKA56DRAFT_38931 [Ilyonectria sp. MPI-CAGE-AT-0026]|nr:hypothetical protein BKA56DRAFT_38931 [Ilyonectria sp. MPI-CAGE-AT-0026]